MRRETTGVGSTAQKQPNFWALAGKRGIGFWSLRVLLEDSFVVL